MNRTLTLSRLHSKGTILSKSNAYQRRLYACLIAFMLFAALPCSAHFNDNHDHKKDSEKRLTPEKTIKEVVQILTGLGFHDLREVEFDYEDQAYEVRARNAQNEKVEIELTTDGQIIAVDRH